MVSVNPSQHRVVVVRSLQQEAHQAVQGLPHAAPFFSVLLRPRERPVVEVATHIEQQVPDFDAGSLLSKVTAIACPA